MVEVILFCQRSEARVHRSAQPARKSGQPLGKAGSFPASIDET